MKFWLAPVGVPEVDQYVALARSLGPEPAWRAFH